MQRVMEGVKLPVLATVIALVVSIIASFYPYFSLGLVPAAFILLTLNRSKIWLLIAATLPLLTVRVDLGSYQLSISILLFLLMIIFILLEGVKGKIKINLGGTATAFLFYFFIAFGVFNSENMLYGFSENLKLALMLLIFVLCANFFVESSKKQNRIFEVLILTSSLYVMYLSYFYLIKFGESYIGLNTEYASTQSKNLLGFYLASVSPLAFVYISNVFKNKSLNMKSVLIFSSSAVILAGLLLTSSRGAWVSVAIGYLAVMSLNKRFSKVMVFVLLITTIAVSSFSNDLARERFMSLFATEDQYYFGVGSTESRKDLNRNSIEIFKTAPIFGVGSYSYEKVLSTVSDSFGEKPSHNEYLRILAENGSVGFILFMAFLVSMIRKSLIIIRKSTIWYEVGVASSTITLFVYLFFRNGLPSHFLWIFCGLTLFFFNKYKKGRNEKRTLPQHS